MQLYSRYVYEKRWTLTDEKDVLRIITEELGDFDPRGTLKYILKEITGGKIVAAGECRFKADLK